MAYVEERFHLGKEFVEQLHKMHVPWGFGQFSEIIYYRTYSRTKDDGSQEHWPDTVQRVVEGVFSIRKDWYKKMHITWDDHKWNALAEEMALAIFDMKFLPPGRGLWAMGTNYIYERGSASLFNCAAGDYLEDVADVSAWVMDMLMLGVGVGASTQKATFATPAIPTDSSVGYWVPDDREGWVDSVKTLINSFYGGPNVKFYYDQIRPKGAPIKGFGGVCSGYEPLEELHQRLRAYLTYHSHSLDRTRLIADIMNSIGACVVSGNVRRSAELLTGSLNDSTFLHLKDYKTNPDRQEIGWMSNNSVILSQSEEFERIPTIADGVRDNGEPGLINLINIQKYGRVGKRKDDAATLMNPCAEICLEDRELCNLAEVFPTRCRDVTDVWRAMELSTLYTSTVALLPTHDASTNAIILRNRRIGVSASGIADWLDSTNQSHVTMALKRGYEEHVEPTNIALAKEAGIPPSVRLTTVKPSGTISLLAGVSAGMHWPVARYAIRRVRVSENSPIVPVLEQAGIIGEKDAYSANTLCFAFPLESGGGKTRAVSEVSIWEQAKMVEMLQWAWADNSVSNTLTFTPEERNQVERVLASTAPHVKSISMLPAAHEYEQAPLESITREQYLNMSAKFKPINWSSFGGSDGIDSKFCTNTECDI